MYHRCDPPSSRLSRSRTFNNERSTIQFESEFGTQNQRSRRQPPRASMPVSSDAAAHYETLSRPSNAWTGGLIVASQPVILQVLVNRANDILATGR